MPRKLEAGGTYSYVLKSDRHLEDPPTFQLAILSGRDDDTVRDLSAEYAETSDRKRRAAIMQELLQLVVKDWRNMGNYVFSVDTAEELLTRREQWELVGDATLEASLSPDERKKLESPPSSETA